MGTNRLNLSLNDSKQSIWDLFPLLGINREQMRTKQALVPISSQFVPSVGINNNYIIINYLDGLFPLYRSHYPRFGRKRLK
jgi:hypothetical protein